MKRPLFLLLAATLFAASPAYAETNIGIVNIQKIMENSKAATSVRNQISAKQKTYQTEFDAKEKALYAEDQALVKESSAATDKAAFQEKVKAFRAKADGIRVDIQKKREQLNKGLGSALDQIQTNVLTIVKEIAAEKKLTAVLPASQMLYADPALDITAEVQKRLDSRLPNVKVNL